MKNNHFILKTRTPLWIEDTSVDVVAKRWEVRMTVYLEDSF